MKRTITVFTLNLNESKERYKEITDITYPLMLHYCDKIGADFVEINERKYPDYPANYEKVQCYNLAKEIGSEYNILFDCDSIIHVDTPDITILAPKDTVVQNGSDFAALRWRYTNDPYLLRDGRFIGCCTWLNVFSEWCLDFWHPCEDLTLKEIKNNIQPVLGEVLDGMTDSVRLIEDYICSRNVARYGLKYATLGQLWPKYGFQQVGFFWHIYNVKPEEKVIKMKEVLSQWNLIEPGPLDVETPVKWRVKL